MTKTKTSSFRLSDEARRILIEFSKRLGVSQAAIVELALRQLDETGLQVGGGVVDKSTCFHGTVRVTEADGVFTARCTVCGEEATGDAVNAALNTPPIDGTPGVYWTQSRDPELYTKSVSLSK